MSKGRKIIITTGDISDFDGFLALSLYKNSGADIVAFIMNYPAYFNYDKDDDYFRFNKDMFSKLDISDETKKELIFDINNYKKDRIGLGYHYNYKEFYKYHKKFFINNNIKVKDFKDEMKNTAYKICKTIWKETNINDGKKTPKLVFIEGCNNEYNPFSIFSLSNEIEIYYNNLNSINIDEEREEITKEPLINFFNSIEDTDEIFMDMNGSLAFYKDDNKIAINNKKENFKAFVIMGGVYYNEPAMTLGKTDFLNRFKSSTMNQFYSPQRTFDFLQMITTTSCKNYIVSNNLISSSFTWGYTIDDKQIINEYEKFKSYINNILPVFTTEGKISKKLFDCYYTSNKKNYKPFDLISSYILNKIINNQLPNIKNNKLVYNKVYGITIINNDDSNPPTLNIINNYISFNKEEESYIKNYKHDYLNDYYEYDITNITLDDDIILDKKILKQSRGSFRKIKKLKNPKKHITKNNKFQKQSTGGLKKIKKLKKYVKNP